MQRGSLRFFLATVGPLLCSAAAAGTTATEPAPQFVSLGRIPAALYRPETATPAVGIVYENGSGSPMATLCAQMAKRGFLVLCSAGSSLAGQGGWERSALDVKLAVNYLRQQPGIRKVVLYGHSGGGAVASFYQAVAENGVAFCQQPVKLTRCGNEWADLPAADGIVFPDAHPGLGVMSLRDLNPSVVTDGSPRRTRVDPALDPFATANGFNPDGPSHYSPAFQQRYARAQAMQMNRLIARALAQRAKQQSGKSSDLTDDILSYAGAAVGGHLDAYDPAAIGTMSTRAPQHLLRNDGSVVTQVIHSVSVGEPFLAARNPGLNGVRSQTLASFLSQGSVRARNAIDDIDWCTSNSVTTCNVGVIHAPTLVIAMGAGTFIRDGERLYELSPAKDKEFIVVEGAVHTADPCKPCEVTPGQYSNSAKNTYDYIAAWINARFATDPSHAQ